MCPLCNLLHTILLNLWYKNMNMYLNISDGNQAIFAIRIASFPPTTSNILQPNKFHNSNHYNNWILTPSSISSLCCTMWKSCTGSIYNRHYSNYNWCTSSIARWKARVRLPIHHNWTFFARSYCWDVTGGKLLTWAIFEGGGSLRSSILGGRGHRQPTTVGWQKTRDCP